MSEKNGHVLSQRDIADCNRYIQEMNTAVEMIGRRLIEIRDRKLYLLYADTLEEFCKKTLRRSPSWLYDQIELQQIRDSIPPQTSKILETDSAVRELGKVPKKRRMGVIGRVLATEKNVTPQTIRDAARKELRPPPPMPPEEPIDVQEILYDRTGYEIPEHLTSFFKESTALGKELVLGASTIRGTIRKIMGTNDPKFAFVNVSSTMSLLDNLYGELTQILPHAVCPYCQGQVKSHCTVCRKTGFLPKHVWDHAVPSDLKAVREKGIKKKG